MNIPTWVMFLFAIVGMGFTLLGPFLPIYNLFLFCFAVLVSYALVATMGQMFQFLLGRTNNLLEAPLEKKRERGDPIIEKEIVTGFVTIGSDMFAVVDGHINGARMPKSMYQDYMNDVLQARDSETGKVLKLPVCNTSYQMTPGDSTAGGHNDDWRDEQ